MNRTRFPDPSLNPFELTKNSTLGVDSGFSGSRDDSGLSRHETRLSNFSSISGGACMRLGEFLHQQKFLLMY